MQPFRPVLVIFATPSSVFPNAFSIKTDVQLWRGKVCVTTVKIEDAINFPAPERWDPSCVEQFASSMSRIVARLVDEKLYDAITTKQVHTWYDLDKQFPAPTGVPE